MGNAQSLRAKATISRRATGPNEVDTQLEAKESLKGSDKASCCSDSDTGEFLDCSEGAANWEDSDGEGNQNKIQLVDGASTSGEESGGSLSALDRLLVQQRRERQLELQSIQERNKRVTDGKHRRRLDRFFARAQGVAETQSDETSSVASEDSDDSGGQDSPGPVVLEVRGLFEAQPVTSVLQSNNFRTQLENIIRGNLIRQEREMETALRLRNAGLGGNAIGGRTLTDAFVPANLHEEASAVSSSTHSSINVHPTSAARQYQHIEGVIPIPPPPPPPGYVNQFAPIPVQPPYGQMQQQQQAYQQNYHQYQNMQRPQPQYNPGPPGQMPNAVPPTGQQQLPSVVPQPPWLINRSNNQQSSNLVEDLQQVQRETIITEISNLVHSQMVTSTLASNFRGQLEVMLENRVAQRAADGAQVMDFVRHLPRSNNIRRNDFSHLGINVNGRPTAAGGAGPGTAQPSGSWSNEMVQLQQQMAELQNMVRVSFDLQLDLQRAIRQEVAAALHGATGGSSATPATGAPAAGPHPASEGHCIICLDQAIDSVLYQCGHMCVCLACGLRLKDLNSHCPMCRAPIRDVIRAYKCHEN